MIIYQLCSSTYLPLKGGIHKFSPKIFTKPHFLKFQNKKFRNQPPQKISQMTRYGKMIRKTFLFFCVWRIGISGNNQFKAIHQGPIRLARVYLSAVTVWTEITRKVWSRVEVISIFEGVKAISKLAKPLSLATSATCQPQHYVIPIFGKVGLFILKILHYHFIQCIFDVQVYLYPPISVWKLGLARRKKEGRVSPGAKLGGIVPEAR